MTHGRSSGDSNSLSRSFSLCSVFARYNRLWHWATTTSSIYLSTTDCCCAGVLVGPQTGLTQRCEHPTNRRRRVAQRYIEHKTPHGRHAESLQRCEYNSRYNMLTMQSRTLKCCQYAEFAGGALLWCGSTVTKVMVISECIRAKGKHIGVVVASRVSSGYYILPMNRSAYLIYVQHNSLVIREAYGHVQDFNVCAQFSTEN